MKVLWLHIEKDHQYEFQCFYCNHRCKLKHCPEMHKREVHYKGKLVCFVYTNKELKHHIQKRCKSRAPKPMVLKHNDNIHKEVEHKCPMCTKITNNQVSLAHHINTIHKSNDNKCDSCGQEFENRETLICTTTEAVGSKAIAAADF
jgi:hypothetical protein